MNNKQSLLILLLAMLFLPWAAQAQEVLTVYENGTATSYEVPVYGTWGDAYQICQFIISADQLVDMEESNITQMSFYLSSPASEAWTGTFSVKLLSSNDTQQGIDNAFENNSFFDTSQEGMTVYTGGLNATDSVLPILFSIPYYYAGGSLLVSVYETTPGNYSAATFFGETVPNASLCGRSSTSLNNVTGRLKSFIPKTTFHFTPNATCSRPAFLNLSQVTSHDATLLWEGDSIGTYRLEWKKASEENWNYTTVTSTSHTLDSLESNTKYNARVRNVCSDYTNSNWRSISFTTLCGITSLPYTCGFENNNDITYWSLVDCHNSTGRVNIISQEGDYCFRFYYNSNPPQYLISPEFEGNTAMEVSFSYRNYLSNYSETFQVGFSTTTNATDAFIWGDEVTASTTTWQHYESFFPIGTKYVAIKYNSNDKYYLYLDDFRFMEFHFSPPECEPRNLPYTYGFEDESELYCWNLVDCQNETGISNSFDIHQGNFCFQFHYNTTSPQYLISPELEANAAMMVSFYYKNYDDNYPETFQVGYSTTTNDTLAFIWGEEITANDQNTWALYENIFPEDTKFVAIKYTSNEQNYLFLDDIAINTIAIYNGSYCAGEAIHLTTVGPSGATYSWTGPNGFTSDIQNPTIENCTEAMAGTYFCTINYGGQAYSYETEVVIYPTPDASFTADTVYVGDATQFASTATTNLEDYTYLWDFGDGQTGSGATTSHTYAKAGTYQVTLQVANEGGCNLIDEITQTVTVLALFCEPYEQCEITFELTDIWGDGWNDAYIEVLDAATGTVLGTVTNENLNGTTGICEYEVNIKTLFVCDDRELQLVWHSGKYDKECSYTIYGADSIYITGSGAMTDTASFFVDCGTTFIIKHTVRAGNWDVADNWDPVGVPTIDEDVLINHDLIVPAGVIAQANNIIMSDSDTTRITLEEGGQLVHNGNALQQTEVIVKKNIIGHGTGNGNWYLITNPSTSAVSPISSLGGFMSGNYDLYGFDYEGSDKKEWRNYKTTPFDLDTCQSGYLYANESDTVLNIHAFVRPSNNKVSKYLKYTTGDFEFPGWHLIGNPFVCNAYLVDSAGAALPFYRMNATGTGLEAVTTAAIAPLEAIFHNVTSDTTVYFTRDVPACDSSLSMVVSGPSTGLGTTSVDNAIISFGEGENMEKFNLHDRGSKLYFTLGSKDYAVVSTTCTTGELLVSFKATEDGVYTLSFNSENVVFGYLHLIDNLTGEDIDLLATPSYSFDAKTTDHENRFKLVFNMK